MDHPKFISGDMTTAFIAEEYPDGFEGVELHSDDLRRSRPPAPQMHRVAEIRRTRVSGRMDNHERKVGTDWVVSLQGQSFAVVIDADRDGATVNFEGGEQLPRVLRLDAGRSAGNHARSNGEPAGAEGRQDHPGLPHPLPRRRSEGHVRTPRQAELAALMPEKGAARHLQDAALPDARAWS